MDRHNSPLTLRITLGGKLRKLRVNAGVSMEQAATALGCNKSKISRLERGEATLWEGQVSRLLNLYGVGPDDPRRLDLLQALPDTRRSPWWHEYLSLVPPEKQGYMSLESEADTLRIWAPRWVPDLLQTGPYAAALWSPSGKREETQQMRVFREARHRRVREAGLRIWVLIDESVLRRQVGSPDVMREQCEALIWASKQPFVTMQVVRLSAGAIPGDEIPFTILRFADEAVSDIVYAGTVVDSICTDKVPVTERYRQVAERLASRAAPVDATPDIIRGIW